MRKIQGVLILVVMDVSCEIIFNSMEDLESVLILVVMDVSCEPRGQDAHCCRGRVLILVVMDVSCEGTRFFNARRVQVLILVVMDVSCERTQPSEKDISPCLNPCCNGCLL